MTRAEPGGGAVLRSVGAGLLLIAASALIVLTGVFNYHRLGIFPHDAVSAMWPCCAGGDVHTPAGQLSRLPLAASPLVAAAQQLGKSEPGRARALMTMAVRRDPQSPEARAWLASDAAVRRDYAAAIVNLDWLYAVDQLSRPRVAKALAALAAYPPSQSAVAAFAQRHPVWLNAVADELVRSDGDPGILFRVLGGGGPGLAGAGYDVSVIRALIKRKQYDLAYLAWLTQLPKDTIPASGYLYDGSFRQMPGSAPFNWTMADTGGASVDYVKPTGLHVSYFGDGAAEFVSQTLLLTPGNYRLRAVANRAGKADGNIAFWKLTCAGAPDPALVMLEVPAAPAPVTASAAFAVTEACEMQALTLAGRPSDYPSTVDVDVKSVAIDRIGELP